MLVEFKNTCENHHDTDLIEVYSIYRKVEGHRYTIVFESMLYDIYVTFDVNNIHEGDTFFFDLRRDIEDHRFLDFSDRDYCTVTIKPKYKGKAKSIVRDAQSELSKLANEYIPKDKDFVYYGD